MKSKGDTLSPSIITNYQRVLSEAFMIHRVSRYDIHGKRIFETNCNKGKGIRKSEKDKR